MPRQRSHRERRAMFRNMGTGARVKVVKPFGINDVPVGSEGIIVQHFGKDRNQPIVAFRGHGRRVLKPDVIEVIRPSKIFEPIKHDVIKVYGTKKELMEKLRENKYNRIGDIGTDQVYSYKYLDDGEGRTADIPFYVKVRDNSVEVHLNKSDIPKRWQYDFESIKEDIVNQVEDDLGVKRL